MSAESSPSPRQGPGPVPQVDESKLPQGQCRYILLLPEIKGQRCACVGFSLNRATPGANCDCGHLACYHVKTAEPPADKNELEQLKHRIQILEEQLDRERQGGLGCVVTRVSELEELVEKSREDIGQEIKGSYRNITRVWQSVEQLERRTGGMEENIRAHGHHLSSVDSQLQNVANRQMELFDADITLEERIDRLEAVSDRSPSRGRQRRGSTPDQLPAQSIVIASRPRRPSSANRSPTGDQPASVQVGAFLNELTCTPVREQPMPRTTYGTWTVHISLLPTSSQPFPFEKDTNAYKRCLSRGLHRMVAVVGSDSHSFETAVSRAFDSLLKGRAWMPLQAKLCDAEKLQGLPMLRPLDSKLVDSSFDVAFLRQHCAVCDASGKIESLYIAMRADTLSWHFLRQAPVFLGGLETSWAYDRYLDPNDPYEDDQMDEDDRPSAGDIVPSFPTLKRAASEISRTSSFGSSTAVGDGEGSRKAQRTVPGLVEVRRRVETV